MVAKKEKAYSWKILYHFSDGCFLDVFWKCPYCDFDNHDIVSSSKTSLIDSDEFLIEHKCELCSKQANIICTKDNKVF